MKFDPFKYFIRVFTLFSCIVSMILLAIENYIQQHSLFFIFYIAICVICRHNSSMLILNFFHKEISFISGSSLNPFISSQKISNISMFDAITAHINFIHCNDIFGEVISDRIIYTKLPVHSTLIG